MYRLLLNLLEHVSADHSVYGSSNGLKLQSLEDQDQEGDGFPEAHTVINNGEESVESAGQRDGICSKYVDQRYYTVCDIGNEIDEYVDHAEEQSQCNCSYGTPSEPLILFSDQYIAKKQDSGDVTACQRQGEDACSHESDRNTKFSFFHFSYLR